MIGEVIAIGDEITSGQRLDTNSQWLAERLGDLGIRVMYHSTVADDLAANVLVFQQALARADIIVASGGLGPTADDLTRQALAAAVGQPLVLHEPSLAHIQALFAKRQRPMPPANEIQAFFPQGAEPLHNPNGSAPGIDCAFERTGKPQARVFCMPGVPAEMKEMWTSQVVPRIAALQPESRVIMHKRIKCFGVGENDLEAMLPDLIRRGREPSVGITVSKATITLRITASGRNAEACDAAMQPTIETIHSCLGDLVYGTEDDELQHAVERLLDNCGITLATLEVGTGGLLAHWLSTTAHANAHYVGGEIVRPASVADEFSREGLIARAQALKQRLHTDYVLAVGPLPGMTLSPPGEPNTVLLVLVTPKDVVTISSPFTGHPDILLVRLAKNALNLVRRKLLKN